MVEIIERQLLIRGQAFCRIFYSLYRVFWWRFI